MSKHNRRLHRRHRTSVARLCRRIDRKLQRAYDLLAHRQRVAGLIGPLSYGRVSDSGPQMRLMQSMTRCRGKSKLARLAERKSLNGPLNGQQFTLLVVDECAHFDAATLAQAVLADAAPTPDPAFVLEHFDPAGQEWRRVPGVGGDTARALIKPATRYAQAHPGIKVRIRRSDNGTRAVHRFQYRQAADTGRWYVGAYR